MTRTPPAAYCRRCRSRRLQMTVWILLHWTCEDCGHGWVTH